MLKLHKNSNGTQHYWETWAEDNRTGIVHWGIIGENGESREVKSKLFKSYKKIIQKEINEKIEDGFAPIEEDDLKFLIIEYKLESDFGNDEDLEKRHKLEAKMNEDLGWCGIGHCDGGSNGMGTMEVACLVVDFEIAKKLIEKKLEHTEFSNYTKIYEEEEVDDEDQTE